MGGEFELIFLGTGISSCVPHIGCITAVPGPDDKQCRTCLSTLTPQGKKNIRRNTSVALRMNGKNGKKVTIVIDVGKTFQAAAVEWFPKFGLRSIDAVLLTHAHADAMNGLDDLRSWTLNQSIQSHIDIYLSKETFSAVQRSFPYLVSKEFASGSGDVPEFQWHMIENNVPFEIEYTGIYVTPLSVHHGRVFSTGPVSFSPLDASLSSTPTILVSKASTPSTNQPLPELMQTETQRSIKHHPYICFGFKIHDSLAYFSDVSHIPDDTWSILQLSEIKILVVDCLRLNSHTSHLGLKEAIATARRLDASRTYLTGFSHDLEHDEFVTIGEVVGGRTDIDVANVTPKERMGLSLIGEGNPVWVRPAYDGLRVFLSDGMVKDESYG